jgi:hypothetical protein
MPLDVAIERVYKAVSKYASDYRSDQGKLLTGMVVSGLLGLPVFFPFGVPSVLIAAAIGASAAGWQELGAMRDRLKPEYSCLKNSVLLEQFIKWLAEEVKKRRGSGLNAPTGFQSDTVTTANILSAYEHTVFAVSHGEHLENNASDPILALFVAKLRQSTNHLPSWVMEAFCHLEQAEAQRSSHLDAAYGYMFGNLSAPANNQVVNPVGQYQLGAVDVPAQAVSPEGEHSLGKPQSETSSSPPSIDSWLATTTQSSVDAPVTSNVDESTTTLEADDMAKKPKEPFHADPLINQCVKTILDCLDAKRSGCKFLEVVDAPKFRRFLFRKQPTTSAASVLSSSEDLFCELGAVLPQLNVQPIVSMVRGGRFAVDVGKPEEQWTKALFKNYIVPCSRSFESPILLPIGINMDGHLKEIDLSKDETCSLLVGGLTGGGKSVWASGAVASLACQYTPDSLKLVLSDTKKVEFRPFAKLPHLLYPVAETVEATVDVLEKVCAEKERREKLLASAGVRNLAQYNDKVSMEERLPRIVVFIEETKTCKESTAFYLEGDGENPTKILYAERFQYCKDEIKRLARAAGIYLVDSTQTPRQNVLPADYRGQFSAFLAFRVSRPEESRICLANQHEDAVHLLGAGDGFYLDNQGLERVQSLYITPEEVDAIVNKVVSLYGTQEDFALNETRKRLESALQQPAPGELPDENPEFQDSSVSDVQTFSTPETQENSPDTYRDYQEIRKLRSAIPPVSKTDIINKHWSYHTSDYQKGNERYMKAVNEHCVEWVLELARDKKAAPRTIVSLIWCVRRNDGPIFENTVARVHEILAENESDS